MAYTVGLTGKIVLLLLLARCGLCCGWGRDGHKVASTVTMHYLTPEAKAGVQALTGNQSLADVSTWADEIGSDPAYRWASPLHYANVQLGASGFDLRQDCPERGCVVSAIIKYAKVLRRKDAGTAEKTEAV